MVAYNPKEWVKMIVQFHKADSFRLLMPAIVGIGIYTTVIVLLEIHVFRWHVKNATSIHSILGFVLSMLLVFRTNTAYDRWWEGRRIWGSFVNNSRNLALKLSVFLPAELQAGSREFGTLISNYVFAAKNHLRSKFLHEEYENVPSLHVEELYGMGHKPNRIAKAMYEKINDWYQQKKITGDQLIVLNEEIRSFTDNLGGCERIRSTPIPYSYSNFLKKVVFIYVFTLPIMFSPDFHFATIPISMLVLYVFASIELIAEEIEDPFGDDPNDLPLDDICARIKLNVTEIFNEQDLSK